MFFRVWENKKNKQHETGMNTDFSTKKEQNMTYGLHVTFKKNNYLHMKLPKKFLFILLAALWGVAPGMMSQSDLQISKVFEQYGERKGAVMVELTNEALDGYDFTLFKSITITNNPQAAAFIRKCLEKDQVGAKKVKQVVANGVPTSVYLQLPRKGKVFRLVLFNEAFRPEHKLILIYIESENDSEDILKLILKKK
jgi:hypothetical protein